MIQLERVLARLPHNLKYIVKKAERPLKKIRNIIYSLSDCKETLQYIGHEIKYPKVIFRYKVDNNVYEIFLIVEIIPKSYFVNTDEEIIDKLLLHIGLSFVTVFFSIDNFKYVCVDRYDMSREAVEFFEEEYLKGLVEFRYKNVLDISQKIQIISRNNNIDIKPKIAKTNTLALTLNGGGKESVVVGELLKQIELPFIWYTMNPANINNNINNIIKISGINKAINLEWKFDPNIKKDSKYIVTYPFLGIVSFIGLLIAHHEKCKYIVVGNEYSSNFGNLFYKGFEINHQYTKSFEFESRFNNYINRNLLEGITYFSLVRPFHEIFLAKLFSNYKEYFEYFVSCNHTVRGDTKDRWCKGCPKCAFVFLVLFPFLENDEIVRIFGSNLFDKRIIRKHIVDMCSAKIKPFECVGTKEESQLALYLSLRKSPEMDFAVKPKRKKLEECCKDIDVSLIKRECLNSFHKPHNIPNELVLLLQKGIEDILIMNQGSSPN